MLVKLYVKAQNWFDSDEGATATEYGLLVGLIALALIVGVGALGTNLNTMFQGMADKVATWK